MMSKWTMGAAVGGLLMMCGGAMAQGLPAGSSVPDRAFFVGAGGSLNWSTYPNQDVFGQGLSNIYNSTGLYAQGEAGGSTSPYLSAQTDISPMVQFGYFQRFAGTNWLWGAKFSYNYLGASSTQDNFLIPQAGRYVGGVTGDLLGNVYAHQSVLKVDNQIDLVPFLGYAFDKGYVYGGAGPSLARMKSELNGLIGFADLFGKTSDITGTPDSFSSTSWVWGATLLAGATYFITPDWFVDLNYSYTMYGTQENHFAAPFSTVHNGLTFSGVAFGYYSGTSDVQTLSLTLNKMF